MAKKETIEAFDHLVKDIIESELPFRGKVIVFGGDFRQTLPVIERASKQTLIEASLPNSPLWNKFHMLKLTENMWAILDPVFSEFLLRVGEGREPVDPQGQITLLNDMVIPYYEKEESLNRLIKSVFLDLLAYSNDPYTMINRCILTPKNSLVDKLNDIMIKWFLGNLHVYVSSDKTIDQRHQGDYENFLNSQNPKGLPPHKLLLKENCPLILLRNLNPIEGLCNGTRLICRELRQRTICTEIAFGQYQGKIIFLPKIPLQTSDSEKNGLPFIRTQFPVQLCFALTINKSQGQTLDYVGIYLREPVFSHGQLYVALSRAKTSAAVKILIEPGTFGDIKVDCKTRNVKILLPIVPWFLQKYKPWTVGSKVQGIIFNNDIPRMSSILQVYKKYNISNAEVKPILPKYHTVEITHQWTITSKTVIEEVLDDEDIMPVKFNYTKFTHLAQYMDDKTKLVGISHYLIYINSMHISA
ncbi:uncharacterized protein [Coffea arabica]|uniref:ATP-dependent DNA helicase n=1 Tax=Coffea arabica TaxID=13443 RepID=A0A6P6TEU7_COFAR